MPRRFPLHPSLGLLLAVALPACRFGSVRPVSASIELTTEHTNAIELGESLCQLGTALISDAPRCDDQRERIDTLTLALGQLSSYGASLSKLAGVRGINPGAAAGSVIRLGETLADKRLAGAERKGIETAAKILARMITTGVKRRGLRKTLEASDRSIQCLAWRAVTATEVWRREVAGIAEAGTKADALDIVLDPTRPGPSAAAPPAPASTDEAPEPLPDPLGPRMRAAEERIESTEETLAKAQRRGVKTERRARQSERLALRAVQVIAADRDLRLETLERGLWSVALSHNHLACERDRLGTTRDRALQAEVDRRIECVLERHLPAPERSAACRPVLAHAQSLRDEACTELHRSDASGRSILDDEGQPLPAGPRCPSPSPP